MKRILTGVALSAMLSPVYALTDPGDPGPDMTTRSNANLDDNEPPVLALKKFYRAYLSTKGNPPRTSAQLVDASLTNSLRQWSECATNKKTSSCSQECVKFTCRYGEAWIADDVDYFTKHDRWYPSWAKAIRPTITYYGSTLTEMNVLIGNDPDPFIHLKVVMREAGGKWRILSVEELR